MTSASVGGPMGIYDYDRRARQQPTIWGADAVTGAPASLMETEADAPSSDSFGHDGAGPPNDKALRRLAQNREAARKSRLRKKAYIRALELSRMKLAQMEQELTRVRRHQGGESSAMGLLTPPPTTVDSGAAAFETEYARWVEGQSRHATDLRLALHSDTPDPHLLAALVDACLAHYDALFLLNSSASRRDAFAVLSGAWRSPAERLFLWIGGFRPSDLLAVLAPQLEPGLDETQGAAVRALQRTARQLEDALAQGFGKLQQTINEALLLTVDGGGFAAQQMGGAVGKLSGLASFVEQADHLRQQTLRNMRKILTPRQAARGLLALADYCHRLRALSELWDARPREPA